MQRSASWAKDNHHIYEATDQSPSTTTCCNLYQRTQRIYNFIKSNKILIKSTENTILIGNWERDIVKKRYGCFTDMGGKFPWNPVVVFSLLPWNQLERESNPTQTTRTTSCHWNQRTQSCFFLQILKQNLDRIPPRLHGPVEEEVISIKLYRWDSDSEGIAKHRR